MCSLSAHLSYPRLGHRFRAKLAINRVVARQLWKVRAENSLVQGCGTPQTRYPQPPDPQPETPTLKPQPNAGTPAGADRFFSRGTLVKEQNLSPRTRSKSKMTVMKHLGTDREQKACMERDTEPYNMSHPKPALCIPPSAQVCSAPKGYLSSYSFSLMVIYFLQVDQQLPCLPVEAFSSLGPTSALPYEWSCRAPLSDAWVLPRSPWSGLRLKSRTASGG